MEIVVNGAHYVVAAASSSTACDAGRRVQMRLQSPYTLSTRPDTHVTFVSLSIYFLSNQIMQRYQHCTKYQTRDDNGGKVNYEKDVIRTY